MDVKIDLDPADVEAAVVKAIIESSIGKKIEAAICKALAGDSWNRRAMVDDAVEGALREEIGRIARDLLLERREQVRAQMQQKLTDEVVLSMCDAALGVMLGRLKVA